MQIVLLGARGSGKTTVGRIIASRLSIEFIDVDDLIVARAGKSIRDIFAQDGQPRFRDIEAEVLADALRWLGDRVISLGGGTVLRDENRDLLNRSSAYRYYLRADAETLHARIAADPRTVETRPALTAYAGSVEEVRQLLTIREPLYREVMTRELDAGHLSPKQLALMILGEVHSDSGGCFPS
jgi:shikimate kinase